MLLRRHGHGGKGGGGGEPTGEPNGLIAWGRAKGGVLAGGYHMLGYFPYPQGCIQLGNIVQIASGASDLCALDRGYNIHTVGGKGASGLGFRLIEGGGSGEREGEGEGLPLINWSQVTGLTATGGLLPLYPKEELKTKLETWHQPEGPPAVPIPSKADHDAGRSSWYVTAVAVGESHCLALTSDGHVLSWGANSAGECGVGWEFSDTIAVTIEKEGRWPTYAPGWVQVSGPGPQTPDPRFGGVTEAEKLKGVIGIAAAARCSYFLKSNGEVWIAGGPAGMGAHPNFFAAKDPVFTPDPTNKPIAIACAIRGYLLLLEKGETVFVGNIADYCAGNGVESSTSTNTRELATPLLADKSVAKNVIGIAMAEYSIKLLKSGGVVYTAGSNLEAQQGVAGFSKSEPQHYCTPMPLLNEGGRKVVAISGDGEITHIGPPLYTRIQGANGGDAYLYLLDDTSVRCSAINWAPETAIGERFIATGAQGTGTSENHLLPQEPLGKLRQITQICAGIVGQIVVQEPGAPASPTIEATASGESVTVTWTGPPGVAPGSLPLWREEEGWQVILLPVNASGTIRSPLLGNLIRSYTFTGVPRGETYEARVVSRSTTEPQVEVLGTPNALREALSTGTPILSLPVNPIPEALEHGDNVVVTKESHTQTFTVYADVEAGTNFIPIAAPGKPVTPNFSYPIGSVVQADGSQKIADPTTFHLSLSWADPPSTEPGFIIEYRHRTPFVQGGEATPFTLSANLSTAENITSLPTSKTPEALQAGEKLLVAFEGESQIFVVSAKTGRGSTSVPVNSQKPSYPFPKEGTTIVAIANATLSTGLSTAAPITVLPVTALPSAIAATAFVRVSAEGHSQVFAVQTKVAKGATSITIHPAVPSYSFPAGAEVITVVHEDWLRVEPDAKGSERSQTITVPPSTHEGVTGNDVKLRVFGSYSGCYKERNREVKVP